MDDSPPFWFNNYSVLLNDYIEFIPNKSMSYNRQLNSISRFSIYLLILFILFNVSYNWYYLPIILFILTFLLYFINSKRNTLTNNNNPIKPICVKPSINNPFMNVLQSDYIMDPNRPKACYNENNENEFNNNLYTNLDNIFVDNNLRRQFYSTAATTIPNNQNNFASWLYKIPKTCKQDNYNCLQYTDIRYGKSSFGKPFG